MTELLWAAVGLVLGVVVGRIIWGGRAARTEECIVFCSDGSEKTNTCDSGKTGECLEELLGKCPGQV